MLGFDTVTPITAGNSETASLSESFSVEGLYDIYIVVDPDNNIDETEENNNTAYTTLTIVDDDTIPPSINDIVISESDGDGDGLIEDNEQVLISWTASDASGISLTDAAVSCATNPVVSLGNEEYQQNFGPCAIDTYTFTISATDNDNSSLSTTKSGTFM